MKFCSGGGLYLYEQLYARYKKCACIRDFWYIRLANQDFEEQLQLAKDDMEKARYELEVKQANKHSFQEMINKINKMQSSHVKPSCPTCNRHFDSNSEVNDLKRNLENDIKNPI